MNENGKPVEAMSASLSDELLKVLVDKVVNIGTEVGALREQVGRLPGAEAVVAGLEQRIGALEEGLGAVGKGLAALGEGLTEVAGKIGKPDRELTDTLWSLKRSLDGYVDFFKEPAKKEVHHRHFLGRPLLTVLGLLVVVGGLVFWLTQSWNKAELYEKNEILWRGVNLSLDSVVTRALNKEVKEFNANGDQYRKDVIGEEERRMELDQRRLEMDEKIGEIKELEGAKRK